MECDNIINYCRIILYYTLILYDIICSDANVVFVKWIAPRVGCDSLTLKVSHSIIHSTNLRIQVPGAGPAQSISMHVFPVSHVVFKHSLISLLQYLL